ncbi:hypothetical protein KP79_PYT17328 [Mizuhopecten yessoensis]|uniref:Uncharacterized protein n=2 Tax=Mizuhopecten yessoensis TaxID=6573 RepID=A0A210QQI0_MIZYE|nr:hypothetical protein KP79_PYT17328 [Mizuhopecten yessoensis]
MVFLCILIVIIVCCVCKKSVSKDILIHPAETVDRDVYGLNKSVYHVDHMPHHHEHHHPHGHSSGVHYDHNGHQIGQNSGHDKHVHVQPNGKTPHVQIPSISVSYHSPEVSMDPTLTAHDQEAQAEQSVPTPLSDNTAETIPPENS